MPMMPFIGVRISCDILARNSLLVRLADSAASLACCSSCSNFLRRVTSRKTTTPPRGTPPGPRIGRPVTRSHTPAGTLALRANSSTSSADSPRMARASGSSCGGQGVFWSGR